MNTGKEEKKEAAAPAAAVTPVAIIFPTKDTKVRDQMFAHLIRLCAHAAAFSARESGDREEHERAFSEQNSIASLGRAAVEKIGLELDDRP